MWLLPWKAEWGWEENRTMVRRQQRGAGFVTWRAVCQVSGLSAESVGWSASWPEVPGLRDRYTITHLCPETSACFLWAGTAALEREKERESQTCKGPRNSWACCFHPALLPCQVSPLPTGYGVNHSTWHPKPSSLAPRIPLQPQLQLLPHYSLSQPQPG